MLLGTTIQSYSQGYFQNFNTGGVPSGITGGVPYQLSVTGGALRIVVNKADMWSGVNFNISPAINLTTARLRKISFKIRTDSVTRGNPYEIMMGMFNGGTQASGRRTRKVIYPTSKWQTVTFDFNDGGFANIWSNVTDVNLVFQPAGYIEGNVRVYIDDFAVGDNGTPGQAALAAPYFLGFENIEIPINSATKQYKIMNAVDCDNLNSNITFSAVSSNTTILPNPTFTNSPFSSNNYYTFTNGLGSTGDMISSRPVRMNMTPNANQYGMVTVTVTATAASQISGITSVPYTYVFNVDVRRNNAPVIGTIPLNVIAGADGTTTINLSNIDDGNSETNNTMTITGTSSDQSVLQNSQINVSFTGTSATATIKITPESFASLPARNCQITVNIADNGGTVLGGTNFSQYVINVTVYPSVYKSPTINVIPNQVDNLTNQGPRTLTITGITDGNGGSQISSLVAVSGNLGILANPVVQYTPGNNYALLTYNSATVGTTNISVTATNFGAPANSNGNSSFTRVFTMLAQAPPLNGYIEPWTVTTVVGGGDAWSALTSMPGTWFVENQGSVQTLSINSGTQSATLNMNKPGTAPQYFSGIWYKPQGGGNLFNFQAYPYLSVTLHTTNTSGRVAADLWDVNGNRYGLASERTLSTSATTYTFCYNGTPTSSNFDFSKIKAVLFNFGVTDFNAGAGNWNTYSGTYYISNLRLGANAQGAGGCPGNTPVCTMSDIGSPYHTTSQTGPKTITVTGISSGSTPIFGPNTNPTNLNISGASGGITVSIQSFNQATGTAILSYTSGGSATTGNFTLTASATGSSNINKNFSINVIAPPGSSNLNVNNDLNANMSDGQKGQTMDAAGAAGICEIFGPGAAFFSDSWYQKIADAKIESMRIGIYDFEPVNDNEDPYVLDKTKLDYPTMQIEFFRKCYAAGVRRFLVTFFSPPNFVKYNRESGVPAPPQQFIVTNTIDSSYYDEYAEYCVAFIKIIKEETGIDIYGISLGNEIQFNQTYQSVMYNQEQYRETVRRVGRRIAAEGLPTFIWGAETLQAQDAGNNYMKTCQNDAETRNYFSAYAVHNYASDGIGQGGPGSAGWGQILSDSRNTLSNGALPKVRNVPPPVGTSGPGGELHNGNGGAGIPVHMTETSGLSETWSDALNMFAAMQIGMTYGNISSFQYLGMNVYSKLYTTYYHYSKYSWGGARRIPLTAVGGTSSTAFRNPDGSVTVVVGNDGTSRTINLTGTNMPGSYKVYQSIDNDFMRYMGTTTGSVFLPPNSMTTIWGGGNAFVATSSVSVSGTSAITAAGGTAQYTASILPVNVVDKSVTWSVITGTGAANINQSGMLMAVANGTVTVRATSNNTPSVFGQIVVTISGQYVRVTGLTVVGQGGINTISTLSGTLQMTGVFAPANAINTAINWSINPSSGLASISPTGLLTAISNGILTVIGVSIDNPTVSGIRLVTISGQGINVTSATVIGTGGVSQITTAGGTLQMVGLYSPANANSNTLPGWSINAPGGIAVINAAGLITANNNGNGTVTVTGAYGGVTAMRVISISGQFVTTPVTSATVTGTGGVNQITTGGGTLQMIATYSPANANTNTLVGWTINAPGAIASINASGLVTAANNGNGTVTVTGTYGGGITATRVVTLSGQYVSIPVSSATVSGTGGVTQISAQGGTLQMIATYSPANANTNTLVGWTINAPGAIASVNASGLVTAANNGNGNVTVTGTYGGGIVANRIITISGQNVLITNMTITGQGGVNQINTAGGKLTINTVILPAAATNKVITWSVSPGGIATLSNASGLNTTLTGLTNGTVTVTGVTQDGTGITRTFVVNVSNQPSSIVVTGQGGATTIATNLGTLQMFAAFTPSASSTSGVSWSLLGGAGSISGSGLLQALVNGTVTVTATALTNPAIFGTLAINISNQTGPFVSVTGLTLSGGNTINSVGGTLILNAGVTPSNATNPTINWSMNPTGVVSLSASSGTSNTLTAQGNGVVTITAASASNPSAFDTRVVTVSGYPIPVTAATIMGTGGVNQITTGGGSLQMIGMYAPANANTNTVVGWSIIAPGGIAIINPVSGLLSAANSGNGTVTVTGNYSGVVANRIVTISGQFVGIAVTSATVTGQGGSTAITTQGGTLQMIGTYSPANANTGTVVGWSIIDPSSLASLNSSGLLTANNTGNGVVTVTGTYGGGISASRAITISGQSISVTSATISGTGGVNQITSQSGTLQMVGTFSPANANTNTTPTWSLISPNGLAIINSSGLLTALNAGNGTVTVVGTYGLIEANVVVSISGQAVGVIAITVTGPSNSITTNGGTLQLGATFNPANASNQNITWSLITVSGGGRATINSTGLLQAIDNGPITVLGVSVNNSSAASTFVVNISGQSVTAIATGLTIDGTGGVRQITASNGTLVIQKYFAPANTSNQNLTWQVSNTTISSIDVNGILQASKNGIVTVSGTTQDGSAITARVVITISGQYEPITGLDLQLPPNANVINTNGGTLQFGAIFTPSTTSETSIGWIITTSTGVSQLDGTGLLRAIDNGVVTVTLYSVFNASLVRHHVVTITNQLPKSADLVQPTPNQILTAGGSLQLTYSFYPPNAIGTQMVYNILPNGIATISPNGLLVANNYHSGPQLVTIVGTIPNTGISDAVIVSIQNQLTPDKYVITSSGGSFTVSGSNQGYSHKLSASSQSLATVDANGVVTAKDEGNGVITVITYLSADTTVSFARTITISGQTSSMSLVMSLDKDNPDEIGDILENKKDYYVYATFNPPVTTDDYIAVKLPKLTFVIDESPNGLVSADGKGGISTFKTGVITITGIYGNVFSVSRVFTIIGANTGTTTGGINYDEKAVSVYPNPAHNTLHIVSKDNIARVMVVNSMGSTVMSKDNVVESLDIAELPSGAYVLLIFNNKGMVKAKFMKE
ncbi:MAG: Ig-like domain-containing protein [Cytophagales bacterium]|nr:Ig-like domain-containing protein [Cytophagales bacterium]